MTVKIAVLKETAARERRVAMVPAVADKLVKLGCTVHVQTGAGGLSKQPDSAYKSATFADDMRSLVGDADVLLSVQPPPDAVVDAMKEGSILLSFIYAHKEPALVKKLRDKKITCFAMELVPRITRAQSMDALSSQAALAGYYGALLGATSIARMMPMTTFATGSIRPGTTLVMGVGVAGLSAIATARRIGSKVEGYDVRPEVKEQVESLGAKFIDTGVDARGQGGYARELTQEEKDKIAAGRHQAYPGGRHHHHHRRDSRPALAEADQQGPGRRHEGRRGDHRPCCGRRWQHRVQPAGRNHPGRPGHHQRAAERAQPPGRTRQRAVCEKPVQPAGTDGQGQGAEAGLGGRSHRQVLPDPRRRNQERSGEEGRRVRLKS